MIHKLTSCDTIVAKVIADLNLTAAELRVTDIIEWIGEAIVKIGGISTYGTNVSGIDSESILPVVGYQVQLPCDLHSLISVAYSKDGSTNNWLPVRMATTPFNSFTGPTTNKSDQIWRDDELAEIFIQMSNHVIDHRTAVCIINENVNLRQTLIDLLATAKGNTNSQLGYGLPMTSHDLQYSIKPGYININQPDGFVKLAYTVIATDEDGYPLVPDHPVVHEAIYWYIVWKLLYPKFLAGDIHAYVYEHAQRQWHATCRGAYGVIMSLNQDGLQTVSNTWNKLIPDSLSDRTFYNNTGSRQIVYNHDKSLRYNGRANIF